MKSHPTPLTTCPQCHHKIDRAAAQDRSGAKPTPGDFSVCINCAGVNVFTDDMRLRVATDGDLNTLSPRDRLEMELGREFIRHLNQKN